MTIVGGASAVGVLLPPTFIFQCRVDGLVSEAQNKEGFVALRTKKGWTGEAWEDILKKQFIPTTKTSLTNRQLLLTDGHRSRFNRRVIEWAAGQGVGVFFPSSPHHTLPVPA